MRCLRASVRSVRKSKMIVPFSHHLFIGQLMLTDVYRSPYYVRATLLTGTDKLARVA